MGNTNLIAIFLTGLITGGLTCMAVQGGLLAATLAQREEERLKNNLKTGGNALPILSFLIAKLTAYTLLGFLLGSLGSFFQMSIITKNILQIAVAIFMIGTALNILDVHPIFRYFVIQPPKFLIRLVRKESKSQDVFAPAILGAFTVFIPCGTTQAMMALAIASGNPTLGAAIMFAFILGTSPIFFILGYFATKLGDVFQQKFMRLAALAIIILALFNLNNSLAIAGININITKPLSGIYCTFAVCDGSNGNVAQAANNNISIDIQSSGYNPSNVTVKAGLPVTINLKNTGGGGCTQAFTIPSLGIQKIVPVGSSDTISFTAPSNPTQIPFMCSMGMFRGIINVI
nr:sulfite exporter TauE/SafE family protein [Candidatus Levybacteria bacterium]